jgi:hypothetical protein
MQLKILTSTRATSVGKVLILTITVVITAACLATMFSGCVKEEEIPMEATRQLAIPSEYEPEAVLPGFGGEIFYECVYGVGKEIGKEAETRTRICINELQDFIEGRLEKDFIEGYVRTYSIYNLKSGEEIGIAYPLLRIFVLKYKSPQAAEQAFSLDTEFMELKDLVLDGVKVKWRKYAHEPIVYMLQSNNFIIYIDGSVEPCKDAVSRIIELYSVPKDNSY